MSVYAAQVASDPLQSTVARIVLAGALGLFLGLEREWSHKSAGIRTFSLVGRPSTVNTAPSRPDRKSVV